MSFVVAVVESGPSFYEVFRKTREEAAEVLCLPTRERVSKLADYFFTHLLSHLRDFNGADPDLSTLIEQLAPFKPRELSIEPLLLKIIRDLQAQNSRLMEASRKKVVPFSSSLAAFPLPLVDTTPECAERTTLFLRKEQDSFSLSETFGMCCLLVAQTMNEQASHLFNVHSMRYFFEDPQAFAEQLLGYEREAEEILHPTAIQTHVSILRRLFQTALIESDGNLIFVRISPELFHWIQNGGPGEKELFEGYEQFVHKEYVGAFNYFEQAALLGNSQGFVEMGNCYWTGKGVPNKDYGKAFECYQKAALLGNSQGFVAMGNCYWRGKGVAAQDYTRAFECYQKATLLGNSNALVNMGKCYWTGNGVPDKDYGKAFECYQKATLLDNSQGFVAMGNCYWTGNGVPDKDYSKAFENWLKAKELNNNEGALNVAKCLTYGKVVPQNREQAKVILLDLISRNVAGASEFYAENF